jgi:hypothetical protein
MKSPLALALPFLHSPLTHSFLSPFSGPFKIHFFFTLSLNQCLSITESLPPCLWPFCHSTSRLLHHSATLPLCLFVSMPPCFFFSLSLCLSASLPLCLSASLPLSLCLFASLPLFISAFLPLCLSVFLSLSLCLCLCLSVLCPLSLRLSACMPRFRLVYFLKSFSFVLMHYFAFFSSFSSLLTFFS